MSAGFQHCPACDEEYVAGIVACVDCGAPLHPGPLPRLEGRAAAAGGADDDEAPLPPGAPDALLVELPGRQAHEAVLALLQEGIICAVECDGAHKLYLPQQRPHEPFAVSRPVSVFVATAHLEAAGEVLASLQSEDLIGAQWADTPPPEDGLDMADDDAAAAAAAEAPAPLAPTRTSMNIVWVVLLGLALLVYLLAR